MFVYDDASHFDSHLLCIFLYRYDFNNFNSTKMCSMDQSTNCKNSI